MRDALAGARGPILDFRPSADQPGWYDDSGWEDRDDAHRVHFETVVSPIETTQARAGRVVLKHEPTNRGAEMTTTAQTYALTQISQAASALDRALGALIREMTDQRRYLHDGLMVQTSVGGSIMGQRPEDITIASVRLSQAIEFAIVVGCDSKSIATAYNNLRS